MTETHTRLDVDERREMLEKVQAVGDGQRVRITYDSSRSTNDKTLEGRAFDVDGCELQVRTDDLKGVAEVDVWNIESTFYAGLVVYATKPGTRSGGRNNLGELLDVEIVGGEA